ncbi:MAG: extracellular solute-binding protein [Clostridiales bacterium]|nr:extracellular solute-binding protein [Clostridiales bacterium]
MKKGKKWKPVMAAGVILAGSLLQAGAVSATQSEETQLQAVGSDAEELQAASDAAEEQQEVSAMSDPETGQTENPETEVTLRISNWEEYIDLGGWDEEETIDLESGDIIGENSMIDDFEEWYYETCGIRVNVEYSTFGTNEDLYNMLTLGDEFDLVCPSEYMVMKLMAEDLLVPLSDEFFDTTNPENYYSIGVSPYIQEIFQSHEIDGESWSKYMAGYMWGVTGIVYNPETVSEEDASSWTILSNPDYRRQITIKDNVRDSYFAAVGALKSDLLTSEEFLSDPDYAQRLEEEMNDVSDETITAVEEYLKTVIENAYSLESDSGKADMITGKVVANLQWSGDGVYTLDQAEEDDMELCFTVPEESTNIYFDGWVMLKSGIGDDTAKQHAAEAFINFVSRPDNVVRNMYYVGYTSVIAGGEDTRVYEYADWCYGAEDDEEETESYPLGYFFSGDSEDGNYVITAPADQVSRQLAAQYPSEETLERASIMVYFDAQTSEKINQMWIHVRCYDIRDVPAWVWVLALAAVAVAVVLSVRRRVKLGGREKKDCDNPARGRER